MHWRAPNARSVAPEAKFATSSCGVGVDGRLARGAESALLLSTHGRAGRSSIDDEVASFLKGPVSAFLGTTDSQSTPDASRIVGISPIGHRRLRVLISEQAVTAVERGQRRKVAVLVTDITNYRSIQWKGRVVETGVARSPGDRGADRSPHHHVRGVECHRRHRSCRGVALFPIDGIPLILELDECFDQTPGPMAGQPLEMHS